MSVINILSPHVADLIAAGEVVERPASVIKELVENSFDAGAENITVEIRGGGATYIRVSDDGCGMTPEDAGIAFLRHATSKLRDEHGLEAIGTMGFRGEALAAIAAVSRVDLFTRVKGKDEGVQITIEGGEETGFGAKLLDIFAGFGSILHGLLNGTDHLRFQCHHLLDKLRTSILLFHRNQQSNNQYRSRYADQSPLRQF